MFSSFICDINNILVTGPTKKAIPYGKSIMDPLLFVIEMK